MTTVNPYGITSANKEKLLLEALELTDTTVKVHPNQAEVLARQLLVLDVDRLGPIIVLINSAKARYHQRMQAEQAD